jgi:hypothetical protein
MLYKLQILPEGKNLIDCQKEFNDIKTVKAEMRRNIKPGMVIFISDASGNTVDFMYRKRRKNKLKEDEN